MKENIGMDGLMAVIFENKDEVLQLSSDIGNLLNGNGCGIVLSSLVLCIGEILDKVPKDARPIVFSEVVSAIKYVYSKIKDEEECSKAG